MFFIPLRDHNPSGRTPWVTYVLLASNILIFLSYQPFAADPRAAAAVLRAFALVPADASLATMVSSMFLHGGWLHLAGNMLFLWIYGDNMEDEMGHLGFAAFYLACGVAAGLAHIASEPGSTVPLVGASGAIAGVMGAYLMFYPRARVDVLFVFIVIFKLVPVPAWLLLAFWFGSQLVSGAATPDGGGGVAYWAHAGGFVAGIALALPLFLRRGGPAYWQATHGLPPHPEAHWERTRVPAAGRRRNRRGPWG